MYGTHVHRDGCYMISFLQRNTIKVLLQQQQQLVLVRYQTPVLLLLVAGPGGEKEFVDWCQNYTLTMMESLVCMCLFVSLSLQSIFLISFLLLLCCIHFTYPITITSSSPVTEKHYEDVSTDASSEENTDTAAAATVSIAAAKSREGGRPSNPVQKSSTTKQSSLMSFFRK